uniref:Uncharacterized protein n=1 Tax=Octopus bimaculoides TaxID=37653 RepID=A0A0L8GY47_OCTBM
MRGVSDGILPDCSGGVASVKARWTLVPTCTACHDSRQERWSAAKGSSRRRR